MNIYHLIKLRESGLWKKSGYCMASAILLVTFACAQNASVKDPPVSVDIQPPVVLSSQLLDEKSIMIEFDEEAHAVLEETEISPALEIGSIKTESTKVTVHFATNQKIGESYVMRMKVVDTANNSLSFIYRFTGWNPNIPDLLINEFNPNGSSSSPDTVELFALSAGNLGGLEFIVGTDESRLGTLTFPAIEINAGDYILIHTKPEGTEDEIDETGETNVSGGRLVTDDSRDFWMQEAPGLPGNNGAITLYERKGGKIIDAVMWSNREDNPDDERLGWTSQSFPWAKDLGTQKAWLGEGDILMPSEVLNASSSTATRSLCRSSNPKDTDSPDDWHIVPTSGKTFGSINNDEVYVP